MNENYHVFSNGELQRKDNTLVVVDDDEEKTYVPIERVEAIYTHGQLDFNTRLANFLNQQGVEIHIFGWNGQYSGSLVPKRGQVSGATVVEQVAAYRHPAQRRTIAAEIARSSVVNMRRNLTYYKRTQGTDYSPQITTLKHITSEFDSTTSVNEILGKEAEARREYYDLYRNVDGFDFGARNYNPPTNELNALISYLNSILYANCTSAIRKTAP